ncbi:MAG: glycosyltransferase family 9 protein [Limisphaerales bacterium]
MAGESILIVKLSALGDVIHTLPALTTLRRHRPGARIAWLVEEAAAELVRGHAALDRLIVWRRGAFERALRSGRLAAAGGEVRRTLRELRATRHDLVIDFQGLAKSAFWVAAAGGAVRAGYGAGQRRNEFAHLVLNRRVPVTAAGAHAVERNLRLLEGLGFPRLPLAYDFPTEPADEAAAEALLAGLGLGAARFVAVNALTRWPTKNWTAAGFAAVGDRLAARGLPAVFTGAPGDRTALDAIAAAMRTPVRRLDGRTPLKVLGALFRRAAAVLSTDTGPMHLAVAVGTPVVALFGPTDPGYTGPHGEGHVVLRAGVACSPCFRRDCRTTQFEKHACMTRLQPEAVAEAVLARAAQP